MIEQSTLTGGQISGFVRRQAFYKRLQAELRQYGGDINPIHKKQGRSHFVEMLPVMRILRFLEAAPEGVSLRLTITARVFAVWYQHDYDFLSEREHGFRDYFRERPLHFLFDRLTEVSKAATRDGEQEVDVYLRQVHIIEQRDALCWIAPASEPAPAPYIMKREETPGGPVYALKQVMKRDDHGAILSTVDVDGMGHCNLATALEQVRALNNHALMPHKESATVTLPNVVSRM